MLNGENFKLLQSLRYTWPVYLGVILVTIRFAMLVIYDTPGSPDGYFLVELGVVVTILISVIYSIRFLSNRANDMPRWVFAINLVYGPLLVCSAATSGLIALIIGSN